MDDFFLNREDSPRLPDGTHDYENIECLDLKLFNASMEALIGGLPVVLPTYDFKLGEKRFVRDPLTLKPAQILILEGCMRSIREARKTLRKPRSSACISTP